MDIFLGGGGGTSQGQEYLPDEVAKGLVSDKKLEKGQAISKREIQAYLTQKGISSMLATDVAMVLRDKFGVTPTFDEDRQMSRSSLIEEISAVVNSDYNKLTESAGTKKYVSKSNKAKAKITESKKTPAPKKLTQEDVEALYRKAVEECLTEAQDDIDRAIIHGLAEMSPEDISAIASLDTLSDYQMAQMEHCFNIGGTTLLEAWADVAYRPHTYRFLPERIQYELKSLDEVNIASIMAGVLNKKRLGQTTPDPKTAPGGHGVNVQVPGQVNPNAYVHPTDAPRAFPPKFSPPEATATSVKPDTISTQQRQGVQKAGGFLSRIKQAFAGKTDSVSPLPAPASQPASEPDAEVKRDTLQGDLPPSQQGPVGVGVSPAVFGGQKTIRRGPNEPAMGRMGRLSPGAPVSSRPALAQDAATAKTDPSMQAPATVPEAPSAPSAAEPEAPSADPASPPLAKTADTAEPPLTKAQATHAKLLKARGKDDPLTRIAAKHVAQHQQAAAGDHEHAKDILDLVGGDKSHPDYQAAVAHLGKAAPEKNTQGFWQQFPDAAKEVGGAVKKAWKGDGSNPEGGWLKRAGKWAAGKAWSGVKSLAHGAGRAIANRSKNSWMSAFMDPETRAQYLKNKLIQRTIDSGNPAAMASALHATTGSHQGGTMVPRNQRPSYVGKGKTGSPA